MRPSSDRPAGTAFRFGFFPYLAITLGLAGAFVLGALFQGAFARDATAPTIVRNALAQSDAVQGARGRTMVLSRVKVEPGAQLATHHHLGTQISRVTAGVLTYTVRRGSASLHHGESDIEPQVARTIHAGHTARIHAGEWLVEQPSDVHEAANRGSVPVIIYLATLLKTGAPPSTPVSLEPGTP